ncbi:hypothetical protein Agub_g15084, partial [Astrephomene gubernaculifera]
MEFFTIGAVITLCAHVWEAVDMIEDSKLGLDHLAQQVHNVQDKLIEAQDLLPQDELKSESVQKAIKGIQDALRECHKVVCKVTKTKPLGRFFMAGKILMKIKTAGTHLSRSLDNLMATLAIRDRNDMRHLRDQTLEICNALLNMRLEQLNAMSRAESQLRRELEVSPTQDFQATLQQ